MLTNCPNCARYVTEEGLCTPCAQDRTTELQRRVLALDIVWKWVSNGDSSAAQRNELQDLCEKHKDELLKLLKRDDV